MPHDLRSRIRSERSGRWGSGAWPLPLPVGFGEVQEVDRAGSRGLDAPRLDAHVPSRGLLAERADRHIEFRDGGIVSEVTA